MLHYTGPLSTVLGVMKTLTFRQSIRTEGRFIRQMSSRDSYGHIFLVVEPATELTLSFSWEVPSSDVPPEYAESVFAGVTGLLGKLELVCCGTCVRAVGGSYNDVDSSPMAYTIASSYAFQDAIDKAGTVVGA